ncbi:MAG TPA: cyclopropane-fatty-acyl-phospholipid synthase family protein, partial [Pirellulales bacterium]|nr:cyclopropane-fatty-acyl-phospholipid synthase family protein [Pirellulales bacterium]
PHRVTLAQSRENVYHHYDIGNDFYRLWLDEQLLYTCAYFCEPTLTLEQAQVAKMDHVCRKVWLRPGDEVIEAGCGWGALALHMARRYGVRVRAFNASHEQILFAREQARREGLSDRVEFVEDDWRNISGACDAFVSVGMLEHVGRENYETLGDMVHRCLRPNGRGLIHSIGRNRPHPTDPWIERRIFPGAYPPAVKEMTTIFEPHGFSILDIENLRLHYAETLEHWLARFETARDQVARMFDERFVRMWRLYLAGSLAAFRSGCLQLFQIVFAPGSNHELPRTRLHQYSDGKPESFFIPGSAETRPGCSAGVSPALGGREGRTPS